jgi:hypothetical protein
MGSVVRTDDFFSESATYVQVHEQVPTLLVCCWLGAHILVQLLQVQPLAQVEVGK